LEIEVKPVLQKLLKEKGITQTRLSEATNISQAVISRFDRNAQHIDVHVFKIARYLEVSVEELFEVIETNKNTTT